MSSKNAIVGLIAAALVAGTALISTGTPALAMGGGHAAGGGNFLIYYPWVGPGSQPSCQFVPVKYYDHGRLHWRSVERCN